MVWKRRIALLRSMKKPAEAISQLSLYLDTFPKDVEAWAELTDLYLSQDMLSQAAYCLEELILLQPFSHYVQTQYAEVMWLLGKEGTALKHWCRSIELCSTFLRGWYGVKTVPRHPTQINRRRQANLPMPTRNRQNNPTMSRSRHLPRSPN
jgi:ER membrane protein complex subunit 2